jgi:hypothetical protein
VDQSRPFFKEFVVKCPTSVARINQHLIREHGIIGGYDLGQDYAHLKNHMLLAVTEMNQKDEIDALASALKEFETKPRKTARKVSKKPVAKKAAAKKPARTSARQPAKSARRAK